MANLVDFFMFFWFCISSWVEMARLDIDSNIVMTDE
jgi:hypothetical protein